MMVSQKIMWLMMVVYDGSKWCMMFYHGFQEGRVACLEFGMPRFCYNEWLTQQWEAPSWPAWCSRGPCWLRAWMMVDIEWWLTNLSPQTHLPPARHVSPAMACRRFCLGTTSSPSPYWMYHATCVCGANIPLESIVPLYADPNFNEVSKVALIKYYCQ